MLTPHSAQAPRFSIWYAGLGLGQILGGIISYGFQGVRHPSFTGWKIMFVVLGCITVLIGFITILLLPDTPMKAHFLSDSEKIALLKHVAMNQTGIQNKKVKPRQVLEVFTDIQLWLLTLLTILVSLNCVKICDNFLLMHYRFPSQAASLPLTLLLSSTILGIHRVVRLF